MLIVKKFGGTSVGNKERILNVAKRCIEDYQKGNDVVVVLSAMGKSTDELINMAKDINPTPSKRELDMLVTTGEQVSVSLMAMAMGSLGVPAISLNAFQVAMHTTHRYGNAQLKRIDTDRIRNELEQRKIVLVTGFQGIDKFDNVTTLGRGGSDTTAVAVASALNAKHCYIFSDVDGIYTTDPNKVTVAKKLETLSYVEMLDIASEGAKVLHNRCIEVGQKFKIPIITKSTFNNKAGTIIQDKIIEDTKVKSIVKNDNIILVNLKYENYSIQLFNQIYNCLLDNGIILANFINSSIHSLDVSFTMKSVYLNKFQNILETEFKMFNSTFSNISRIAIIGHGIMHDDKILRQTLDILKINELEPISLETNESKIAITFKEKISNSILEQLHTKLIV